MNPQPSQSFLRVNTPGQPDDNFYLSCSGCKREPQDCGPDRNKLAPKARAAGYKLTPGLGWICNDCWNAIAPTDIRGTIETITR